MSSKKNKYFKCETSILVDALQKNISAAQETVYKKYFGLMISISIRYMGNSEDAKEVVNSGFLKIFTKVSSYGGKGSFEAWMKRIIVNTALDKLREKQLQYVEIDDEFHVNSDYMVNNDALADFAKEDILMLVASLPPASRNVFNLYVLEGFKHKEIAEQLNISESTSNWHLNNARKILIKKIEILYNG